MGNLSVIDLLIVTFYTLAVFGIGFWVSRHQKETTEVYFLAGRKMGWLVIGASLFVTNISTEHFVGLAGSGAENGLVVTHFEWMAILGLLLLGWVFAPLLIKAKVTTVPEFLEKRFNRPTRMYLTTISIITYVVTKIAVTLFAGSILLNAMLGWDIYISTLVMVIITGIYTIVGGLTAVMYTQVFQLLVLIVGSGILTFWGLHQVGGFAGLQAQLPESYFTMFKSISDPYFPWTGIVFGAPILAIWYWGTDQYIVQRVLSARNVEQARTATIFTGFLKILPVFLMVLPGMIGAVLVPGTRGDQVLTFLLSEQFLPVGMRGLVLAGFLAAMMSSLSSVFNSTAALFVNDFYRTAHPKASQRKLVLVGRLATTVIVISAILWIPLTRLFDQQVYLYLQSLQAYIAPPITAVFLFGIFSPRVNSRGALSALIAGGALGAIRLFLELLQRAFRLNFGLFNSFVQLNFLHFALLLFVFSTAVLFLFSRWRVPQPSFNPLIFSQNKQVLFQRAPYQVALSVLLLFLFFTVYGAFL